MSEQAYSYETYPGTVIVRTCRDGYTRHELLAELSQFAGCVVTDDDERSDAWIASLVGRDAATLAGMGV